MDRIKKLVVVPYEIEQTLYEKENRGKKGKSKPSKLNLNKTGSPVINVKPSKGWTVVK